MTYNVKKPKNNKLIKWPKGDVFSSYLMVFWTTYLYPFVRVGHIFKRYRSIWLAYLFLKKKMSPNNDLRFVSYFVFCLCFRNQITKKRCSKNQRTLKSRSLSVCACAFLCCFWVVALVPSLLMMTLPTEMSLTATRSLFE